MRTPRRPRPRGPTPVVATGATPTTTPVPNQTPTADSLPATALVTAPVALTAQPVITEIEGSPTPQTTTPTTPAPAAPALLAADAAVTHDVPGTGERTDRVDDRSGSRRERGADLGRDTHRARRTARDDAPVAVGRPSHRDDVADACSTERITAAPPAVLAATVDAALDATVDAETDAATDVDRAGPTLADPTTPPALANLIRRSAATTRRPPGSAVRHRSTAEAADDLAAPLRLAPPRTIAVDLNDEGLGPLRVIATSEQRTVHLTVSAGEAVVRDALVRQQADLRHDLADAGLQLGSFEVDARAADRDHTDQPATARDRDRPTARSAGAPPPPPRLPTPMTPTGASICVSDAHPRLTTPLKTQTGLRHANHDHPAHQHQRCRGHHRHGAGTGRTRRRSSTATRS